MEAEEVPRPEEVEVGLVAEATTEATTAVATEVEAMDHLEEEAIEEDIVAAQEVTLHIRILGDLHVTESFLRMESLSWMECIQESFLRVETFLSSDGMTCIDGHWNCQLRVVSSHGIVEVQVCRHFVEMKHDLVSGEGRASYCRILRPADRACLEI